MSGEAVFVNAFGLSFAHRLPVENQAIRVVDDAIEDGIGEGRIADDLMPGLDRELACDQRGSSAIATRWAM